MVSPGRRRRRGLSRRRPLRNSKERILIVSEDKVTAKEYFDAFKHAHRNNLVHVEVVGDGAEPLHVVERCIAERNEASGRAKTEHDSNLGFDVVWAVFDVDEHPRLDRAKELARQEGIRCAISNPCFELWAILHFQDQTAHIERGKLQTKLKRHLPKYHPDDNKRLDYAKTAPGYDDALRRARQLEAIAVRNGKPGSNPTTNIYELTELIRRKS